MPFIQCYVNPLDWLGFYYSIFVAALLHCKSEMDKVFLVCLTLSLRSWACFSTTCVSLSCLGVKYVKLCFDHCTNDLINHWSIVYSFKSWNILKQLVCSESEDQSLGFLVHPVFIGQHLKLNQQLHVLYLPGWGGQSLPPQMSWDW